MSAWWPTICTFLAQIVEVFMQKVQKPTHYFRGLPMFLGVATHQPPI
jgi:hypothetical protein